MFITVEGIEGSGKTSQVELLSRWLTNANIDHISTKEPGTVISRECQQIRQLLLSPDNNIVPQAELFLFLADRSQHVEQIILPALSNSQWVVSDRYSDSTKVYQGVARGLGSQLVKDMIDYASNFVNPDLTFILDLPAEKGLLRAKKSNVEFEGGDRMEREALGFHNSLRQGFLDLAKTHRRYIVIDANRSIDEIHKDIVEEVKTRCL